MSSSIPAWVAAAAPPVLLCGPLIWCGVRRLVRSLRAADRLCSEVAAAGRPFTAQERAVSQAQMVAYAERIVCAQYEAVAALYEQPPMSDSRS